RRAAAAEGDVTGAGRGAAGHLEDADGVGEARADAHLVGGQGAGAGELVVAVTGGIRSDAEVVDSCRLGRGKGTGSLINRATAGARAGVAHEHVHRGDYARQIQHRV